MSKRRYCKGRITHGPPYSDEVVEEIAQRFAEHATFRMARLSLELGESDYKRGYKMLDIDDLNQPVEAQLWHRVSTRVIAVKAERERERERAREERLARERLTGEWQS